MTMPTFEVDVGNATYQVDAPDEKTAWKMANDVHLKEKPESPSMQAGRDLAKSSILGIPQYLRPGAGIQGAINALQGPTFGFLDEIVGAAAAPFGKYQQARDYVRGATAQYRQDYPITAAITSGMTAAPTMMFGAGVPSAAKTVFGITPKIVQASRVGGIQGALGGTGESTAEDLTGIAADTAKGAASGVTLGGASQGILSGGGKVVSNVSQRLSPSSAKDAATVKLAEALLRGAPEGSVFTQPGAISTPANQAAARLQRFGPEATIADVSGQAPKQLLDTLATLPGKTKDAVEKLIRERQVGRSGRIMTAADESLRTQGRGFVASLDALEETQKAAQAPFRKQLEGLSVRADDELMKILNREPAAFKAASDLARREGGVAIDLSKLKAGDDIPFDALDTVKKALWTIAEKEKVNFAATAESRAVNGIRVDLTNKMDLLSPKDAGGSIYKQARDAFGGPAELRAAIEAGRGSMKTDAIGVAELTKGMGTGELEAFRIGALQSLRDKVGTEAGQTSLLKMWKETKTSDKLKEIFGNDYRKFSVEVAKEARLKALESTGRGSPTAGRLYAAGDLDNQALLDAAQAAKSGITGNLVEALKSTGKVFNRVAMPETTRNELAKMLMSRGREAQANLENVDRLIRSLNASAATQSALTGGVSGQFANKLGNQP